MNLSEITTKCYILALIIRDDDERLLLGDGFFEFTDKLQHFTPNTFQNDVVELQGTDGQLLAGQVRRTAMQSFDGYIGDATVSQQTTEDNRHRFLAFFRKKHFYKVIYIFPDGTAIKRQRGYIVDAPSVKEMFQRFPEYHVGLNFEDPNYYEYDEDESGQEIFAHIQEISLSNLLVGGLVWDEYGAVSHAIAWGDYETQTTSDGYAQITDGVLGAPLNFEQLFGNATQETTTGKNLLNTNALNRTLPYTTTSRGITFKLDADGSITINGQNDGTGNSVLWLYDAGTPLTLNAGSYTGDLNPSNGTYYAVDLVAYDGTKYWGFREDMTNPMGQGDWRFYIQVGNGTTTNFSNYKIYPMLEAGTTKSPYEPYTGGSPMPNPQFPSPVNVVSGAQTVKITGKNLAKIDPATRTSKGITYVWSADGSVTLNGTATAISATDATDDFPIKLRAGQVYTFSANNAEISSGVTIRLERGNGKTGVFASGITNDTSKTWSFNGEDTDARLQVRIASGTTLNNFTLRPQLELGNQASDFEPYQGQTQIINLGSLELAKIGTYQDYIYNDNGTWYIRRAIGKVVLDGTEDGWDITGGGNGYRLATPDIILTPSGELAPIMSDYYTTTTFSRIYNANIDYGISNHNNNHWLAFRNKDITSLANFKTWLGTHNTTVYYALATPTDTEITDSELIEQLNHIYSLYGGVNNLWLIPSGGALGKIGVRFPTSYSLNGSGYEWEEGAGSAQNIVYVEGIDRTLPVWKVIGPAQNPTLTNITTGQTISWQSYVPEGQELIVDMDAQTAMLSGANVFAFIEGEWLELQTGQNRLDYSADGATDPSTIEWNGVVG